MYLKSLQLVGFKSFANKTKLRFEPGMTAIVGPNGCGKSNVSDAIRWVLGEQRPKALRGSSMQDVIFNGTDGRKPLGMAEASITFADCEELLKTEYNEVTVTRRVFRTGEGQYFINKTPCRLKDVQRLFMGTGIGTTSYSVMAQGQIDAVLSSRPEDRRAIFEEASGITKFKADKKEAVRKLQHTDANLMRLSDVIREVKRRIGSLQRQAGKARRYKTLQGELRTLDLFTTRERLGRLEARIRECSGHDEKLGKQVASLQTHVAALEEETAQHHDALLQAERDIGTEQERSVQTQGSLNRAKDIVRLNNQRIEEYQRWSERDSLEAEQTQAQLEAQREKVANLEKSKATAKEELEAAEEALTQSRHAFEDHQKEMDTARIRLQKLREMSVQKESESARAQNRLSEIESQERETVIQRERLSVEKTQLSRVVQDFSKREGELNKETKRLNGKVAAYDQTLETLETERVALTNALDECVEARSALHSQAAAKEAQIKTLEASEQTEGEFPAGSQFLLDDPTKAGTDARTVLGPLADHVSIKTDASPALEVALRSWLDAVIIESKQAARKIVTAVKEDKEGTTRLLTPVGESKELLLPKRATRLLDAIEISKEAKSIIEHILANVALVDALEEIPETIPVGCTYVTKDGALFSADGAIEWWQPESQTANPLGRRLVIAEARESLARLELQIQSCSERRGELTAKTQSVSETIKATRNQRDDSRRASAHAEGELNSLQRDAKTSMKRLETVTWELDAICKNSESSDKEKKDLAGQLAELRKQRENVVATIAAQSQELQQLEKRHGDLQANLTEARIMHASLAQRSDHLQSEHRGLSTRIGELQRQVEGRTQGIASYTSSIQELTEEIARTEKNLPDLEKRMADVAARLDERRKSRESRQMALSKKEAVLSEKRRELEQQRSQKNTIEIELTEAKTRHQNRLDRIFEEYKIDADDLRNEPDPEWENSVAPPIEEVEQRVGALRDKLEAMGPVNLVAIDEYKELEERYTFLVDQERDLIQAKEQLLDMIKKINKTTSAMFKETFEKANTNFQKMYTRLFNGGTAKLVLTDEEDVLECGIEIIARPPGKRLQNVSLLSGGERTLTAVSLLFAIYEIKPSPFCLLDELDAALDDANIGRFVKTLRGFLSQSQFIIITHNQHTIAGSDIVYGVTMPEKGVSRIVSLKLPAVISKDVKPVTAKAEEGTEPPSPEEIAAIEAAEAEREEKRRKRREKRAAKKAEREAAEAEKGE